MKRIILAAGVALLFTGCATYHDPRPQAELDRDAEIWTHAHGLRVAISPDQLTDCSSLGVVSEHYFEAPPGDPVKRPMDAAWPEYILRFKTAQLGGDAALASTHIKKWTGEPNLQESRVLGEAYLCSQPALATASQ
jgi:hypothetical protein